MAAGRERLEERTRFFLQRWDLQWKCYVNIDSLDEMIDGDRLTEVRTGVRLAKAEAAPHCDDTEVS